MVNLLKANCLKCGNQWTIRVPYPKECPRCKNQKWNTTEDGRRNKKPIKFDLKNKILRSREQARSKIEVLQGREKIRSMLIHHKNGNPLNNDLSNLEVISRSEHKILHNKFKNKKRITRIKNYGVNIKKKEKKWVIALNAKKDGQD